MKLLVLNLPFEKPIIRRYSCSYFAKGFLYPPQELLRSATILKQNKKNTIYFIDGIAEKKTLREIIDFINKQKIEIIITELGIDFIDRDYQELVSLKQKTNIKIIAISYLATIYPNHFEKIDIILNHFFEEKLDFVKKVTESKSFLNMLKKINLKEKITTKNPNIITKVDRTLINPTKYQELLVNGKTAFLYFGFGCPFNCNYCIRSYDLNTYHLRKKEHIFTELKELKKQGYKNIRILDDNVTIHKRFLKELFEFLNKEKIKFNFYGLSRIDLLDKETITLLHKLNFKRLYLGLETLDNKMQKYYNKNINTNIEYLKKRFYNLKQNKIETGLWLLYHPQKDNKKKILSWIPILSKLDVDFVDMSIITAYPKTEFFKMEKQNITFTINPFKSKFKNQKQNNPGLIEKEFFIKYLFYPKNIFKHIKLCFKYPKFAFNIVSDLIKIKRNKSIEKQREDII